MSGGSPSGSENGQEGLAGNKSPNAHRSVIGTGRTIGRSASPAKRSAADMEGSEKQQVNPAGSFPERQDDEALTLFDEAMAQMPPTESSADASGDISSGASTSATSFESDAAPPRALSEEQVERPKSSTRYSTAELDQQVTQVTQLAHNELKDGDVGVAISTKWLARVYARTTDGLKNSEYDKSDREGEIGPVDNSNLLPDGVFDKTRMYDSKNKPYVPLNLGSSISQDLEMLPAQVYGLIVGWYGQVAGQHSIIRYAHDTAPDGATSRNIQYELYPPIINVRKVPFAQQAVGQFSPEAVVQLVASRNERFQSFLKRAKEAAGVPMATKVKIFRQLDPAEVLTDNSGTAGVLSPPASQHPSPKRDTAHELVIDSASFSNMELGKDFEHIDAPDETGNANYNGKSQCELFGLTQDQTVILEEQMGGPAGGEFASDAKMAVANKKKGLLNPKSQNKKSDTPNGSRGTSPAPGMMTRGRARRDGRTRGTVGLGNLGNTCYMNSALQCIRSVEELAIYFLQGQFKKEINTDNPLGHNGLMAKKYAQVLQNIYGDNAGSSYSPSEFKRTLGFVAPLFSGYGQQDSQEFLSFLVDALHEDLNRVLKKPYIENPDSDDKTVHDPQAIIELGEKFRTNHKLRNDSVAMDLFSGFYKNTMECPECDKVSVTFDPYSLLTVQLPVENTWQHEVTFISCRGVLTRHQMDMDKNASIKTLKSAIAGIHLDSSAKNFWMVEIYQHKFYKYFEDHITLGEAGVQATDTLFIFEMGAPPSNVPSPSKKSVSPYSTWKRDDDIPEMDSEMADNFIVPVLSRKKNRFGNGWDSTLHPFYIQVSREEAQDYNVILKKVLIGIAQMTSAPILTDRAAKAKTSGSAPDESNAGADGRNDAMNDEAARVSDGSVPSEDGYVSVSLHSQHVPDSSGAQQDDEANQGLSKTGPQIPADFMDSGYFLDPALRNMVSDMRYGESAEGMHCTGMNGIRDRSDHIMYDRVLPKNRRNSLESSSSSDHSTTDAASQTDDRGTPESDEDEESPALSHESPMALDQDSEDELVGGTVFPSADQLMNIYGRGGRKSRGKGSKHGRGGKKGRKGKMKTYGRKDRRPQSSASNRSSNYRSLHQQQRDVDDENPYYIKLGEGIVLEWKSDMLNNLFGGDPNDEQEHLGVSTWNPETVPVHHDPVLEGKKVQREHRKKFGIQLEDCFAETGKTEVLSEDNAWYCNRCKELRRAKKTLEIWTAPDILVVHLKRFSSNSRMRDKIDVLVNYPIEGLELEDKIGLKEDGKDYTYDLFAVDNHFGGLGGGHYTAYAKNFYDGKWYDYNDSHVTKLSEDRLQSVAAYLLFYRRRSEQPLGPQYLQDLVNEYRNPPSATASADENDENSGEGRLGDPNPNLLASSRLPGSSSALVGTGVGAGSIRNSSGGGSGAGAGQGQRTMGMQTVRRNEAGGFVREDEDEGIDMSGDVAGIGMMNGKVVFGPQRPPTYGDQGTASWGFDGLTDNRSTEDDADMLLTAADDGTSSTAAINDDESDDLRTRMAEDFGHDGDFADARETHNNSPSGNWNDPNDDIYLGENSDQWDQHDMYSSAHERSSEDDTAMHIDNIAASALHHQTASPPAAEVRVDDDEDNDMHFKMD